MSPSEIPFLLHQDMHIKRAGGQPGYGRVRRPDGARMLTFPAFHLPSTMDSWNFNPGNHGEITGIPLAEHMQNPYSLHTTLAESLVTYSYESPFTRNEVTVSASTATAHPTFHTTPHTTMSLMTSLIVLTWSNA